MISVIAILLFLIFLCISSIHFYWSLGGRRGTKAVFPVKDENHPAKNPGPVPTFIVATGLLCFGLFYLIKCRFIPVDLPGWLNKYGLWVIAGIFILRAIGEFKYLGFFKKIRQTEFGKNDTRYYSPLSLAIGLLTLIIELNS